MNPFSIQPRLLLDAASGDGNGFEKKVLEGVEAIRTKQDTLVQNYDQLTKETKAAFEDITKLKKDANDSSTARNELLQKFNLLDARIRQEVRSAFGCPIKRIQNDEGLRHALNIAVRLAMNKEGDMTKLVKNGFAKELVARALGEDSSPGSTMIQSDLLKEIYDTIAGYGVWNTFAVRRLGTKTTSIPIKTARPVANFVLTEGGTIDDDATKAGSASDLSVEVIAVLLNVSLQLLQDSEFDVTADVMEDFAEAYAYRMDVMALTADGTSDATNGGFSGAFVGGTAATAAAGNTTVEALDEADMRRALTTVDPVVLSRAARWWIHPQMLVRLLAIKDQNGRPIFLTASEAPTPGGIGSIYGYPVTLSHAAPSTNAAAGKVALFGDPNANVIGVRQDYSFEASDHHKWSTLQRSFRAYGRAGSLVRRATGLAYVKLAA